MAEYEKRSCLCRDSPSVWLCLLTLHREIQSAYGAVGVVGAVGVGVAGDGVAGDGVAGDGVAGVGVAGDGVAGDGVAGDGVAGDGVAGDGVAGVGVTDGFGVGVAALSVIDFANP